MATGFEDDRPRRGPFDELYPLDPREMFIRGIEGGEINVPRIEDIGRVQREFGLSGGAESEEPRQQGGFRLGFDFGPGDDEGMQFARGPRERFLEDVESGTTRMPRIGSLRDRSTFEDEDPEMASILANEMPPRFTPELEDERPQGFWETLGDLGGVQGEVDLNESGPLGALIALGATFANVRAAKAKKELEGRQQRNKTRQDMSDRLNTISEQRDRAFRLERARQLGEARRFTREGGGGARTAMVYVPGAGNVPVTSQLGQRFLTHGAEEAGTPLAPRWKPGGDTSPSGAPRPSPVISSMEEQEAEARYKDLLGKWRSNYWWKRSGGNPENYSMWSKSDMPPEEMARANADPQVSAALTRWQSSIVLRIARNARSQEDLDDLEAALERAPAVVRNDPRVLQAVEDAASRVR